MRKDVENVMQVIVKRFQKERKELPKKVIYEHGADQNILIFPALFNTVLYF